MVVVVVVVVRHSHHCIRPPGVGAAIDAVQLCFIQEPEVRVS